MTTSDVPGVNRVHAMRWQESVGVQTHDLVAIEEPLEIRLAGVPVVVTMRTPGDDFDLAAGFLYTERVIRSPTDIASIAHCETDDPRSAANVVNVNTTNTALADPGRWGRTFAANSACGVCGKAGIEQVRIEADPIVSSLRLRVEILLALSDTLCREQGLFDLTGGVHAAGLFDLSGRLLVAREDVGRHNAVDKVIGAMVRRGSVPLDQCVLCVSSRASFEIVQKALIAGIPFVATVSAPSTLAIDLACEVGMTLAGFLRGTRFNVYAGEERIVFDDRAPVRA